MVTLGALGALVVLTLLSRLPLLTPRLAHWDAVNYALGLHEFNIAAHQPHPPGSPYFILLGRAFLAVFYPGDDNLALILVSLLASVAAVLAEYALVGLLFGRRAALLAALVLMTQPIFWGYGTMGNAWTVLAFLALAIGTVCLLLLRGHTRLVLPSALLMAVASGFRLDVTLFLAPLWLWAMWRVEPDVRRRSVAIAVVVVGVLAWLVPVAVIAGGFDAWSNRLLALLPPPDLTPDARIRQFLVNTAISFGTLALVLGPVVVLIAIGHRRSALGVVRGEMAVFWALWILPAFTFLWVVDSTEPGHDLVYIVALVALGAGMLIAAAPTRRRFAAYGAVLVSAQAAVFLFAPPLDGRPLAWTADSMLLNITAPGLREQQDSLDSTLRIIRRSFTPDTAVLVTLVGQDPYRYLMYYLPDYQVVRLDTQAGTVLAARARQQGNLIQPADCLFTPVVRHAVWVIGTRSAQIAVPEQARRVDPPEDTGPFQVWDLDPDQSTADYFGFKLGGPCAVG